MYDYQNKENNVPKIHTVMENIFMYLPAVNSIYGILLYSLLVYIFKVLIRMFCSKPYNPHEEEDEDYGKATHDKEFITRLEATRKKKTQEAEELLKKIN